MRRLPAERTNARLPALTAAGLFTLVQVKEEEQEEGEQQQQLIIVIHQTIERSPGAKGVQTRQRLLL